MAGNFLRRDGTGGHIIGFQTLCFESQYYAFIPKRVDGMYRV